MIVKERDVPNLEESIVQAVVGAFFLPLIWLVESICDIWRAIISQELMENFANGWLRYDGSFDNAGFNLGIYTTTDREQLDAQEVLEALAS